MPRSLLDVQFVTLHANYKVNGQTSSADWTSLHYAAKGGNPEIVKTLLDGKADVNARTTVMIIMYM